MHCQQFIPRWLVCVVLLCGVNSLRAAEAFPPGWLPVNQLDGKPTWREVRDIKDRIHLCLLYTSPSPRDKRQSRMPSSA